MHEIENYNCEGLCCQKICSEKYTHFTNQTIYGIEIQLVFCKKHVEEFESNFLKKEEEDDNKTTS